MKWQFSLMNSKMQQRVVILAALKSMNKKFSVATPGRTHSIEEVIFGDFNETDNDPNLVVRHWDEVTNILDVKGNPIPLKDMVEIYVELDTDQSGQIRNLMIVHN